MPTCLNEGGTLVDTPNEAGGLDDEEEEIAEMLDSGKEEGKEVLLNGAPYDEDDDDDVTDVAPEDEEDVDTTIPDEKILPGELLTVGKTEGSGETIPPEEPVSSLPEDETEDGYNKEEEIIEEEINTDTDADSSPDAPAENPEDGPDPETDEDKLSQGQLAEETTEEVDTGTDTGEDTTVAPTYAEEEIEEIDATTVIPDDESEDTGPVTDELPQGQPLDGYADGDDDNIVDGGNDTAITLENCIYYYQGPI